MLAIFTRAGKVAARPVTTPSAVLNSSCCVAKKNVRLPIKRTENGQRIASHVLVAWPSRAFTSARDDAESTNWRKVSFMTTKLGCRRTRPRAISVAHCPLRLLVDETFLGNLSEHQLFSRRAALPDLAIVVLGAIADLDEKLIDVERRQVGVPRVGQHVLPELAHHRVATLIVQELGYGAQIQAR